jgi:hypothetical protein
MPGRKLAALTIAGSPGVAGRTWRVKAFGKKGGVFVVTL